MKKTLSQAQLDRMAMKAFPIYLAAPKASASERARLSRKRQFGTRRTNRRYKSVSVPGELWNASVQLKRATEKRAPGGYLYNYEFLLGPILGRVR